MGRGTPAERYAAAAKRRKIINITAAVAAVIILVFAATVTLAERFRWQGIPKWADVYAFFGISEPVSTFGTVSEIHFVDVGQGDCTIIIQNGEVAVIDAGEGTYGDDVVAYLKKLNIKKIKLLIMSHAHSDHIGGMYNILTDFEVDAILAPDFTLGPLPASSYFERTLLAAKDKGVPLNTAVTGQVYELGDGTIEVISGGIYSESGLNNTSLILRYSAKGISCLFTGDAEKEAENALLKSGADVSAMIFQAGHHGSYTSNALALVQRINPIYAVISCGENNEFEHPHKETLETFEKIGTIVYRTDFHGNIVVGTDGDEIKISTSKK